MEKRKEKQTMNKEDYKKKYSPNPGKGKDDNKKYYPKPGEEQENQPNYSPDPDKEKGKGDYRELREENAFSLPKYKFDIFWPSSEPINPDKECADITVKVNKTDYSGTVITPDYIDYLFQKNSSTGEFANGSYFCMPRMIVVKKIERGVIKKTIDDLFRRGVFEKYFE